MAATIIALVLSQALFTTGDLLARRAMGTHGFHAHVFLMPWFWVYFTLRTAAMFGQLYVFSGTQLGRSMAGFGAVSLILSNVLGFLVLGEAITARTLVAVSLAVAAFVVLATGK